MAANCMADALKHPHP
jgi:hypothetical protein